MVGERVKRFGDREPLIRRASNRLTSKTHNIRRGPDKFVDENTPVLPNRNVGEGRLVGMVAAAVATVVEDTVGVPFGASSDIVDSEVGNGYVVYTVNVNAPFEKMAEARATIDSTTGFSSFLTDKIDIEGVTVQKTRVLRDTFQVEVKVED